jgi:hypothetical protein
MDLSPTISRRSSTSIRRDPTAPYGCMALDADRARIF